MGDSKTKTARLSAISMIIGNNLIRSQEELMSYLKAAGYELTQATLSRDLKELQVAKVPTVDGYRYRLHPTPATARHSATAVLSVDVSGNMMVIKTGPGFAGAIASTIDSNVHTRNILGTVAGDDTVFIVLRSPELVQEALEDMSQVIPGIQNKLL